MSVTPETRVRLNIEELSSITTLGEFFLVNEFTAREQADMWQAIHDRELYRGGGGAAVEWTLEAA